MSDMPDTETRTRLTVYLPAELAEAVAANAADRGQTLSEWVRRAATDSLMARDESFSPAADRQRAKRMAKP